MLLYKENSFSNFELSLIPTALVVELFFFLARNHIFSDGVEIGHCGSHKSGIDTHPNEETRVTNLDNWIGDVVLLHHITYMGVKSCEANVIRAIILFLGGAVPLVYSVLLYSLSFGNVSDSL